MPIIYPPRQPSARGPRFSIRIDYPNGETSYLSHKGKTEWCKPTAKKYLDQWTKSHGTGHKVTATIEPA